MNSLKQVTIEAIVYVCIHTCMHVSAHVRCVKRLVESNQQISTFRNKNLFELLLLFYRFLLLHLHYIRLSAKSAPLNVDSFQEFVLGLFSTQNSYFFF